MKLTVACQVCGQILVTVQKTNSFTPDDIALYQSGCYCMTVAGQGVDANGNPITLYDGNTDIQATMTQN